jgi:sucrose-6F-phosphate phosphohydrolase
MGPRIILVTDIDGTLVGYDAALEQFAAWHEEDRHHHRLVYATGRHLASLERLIATTDLPIPDAAITAVGTEIHDSRGHRWPGWPDVFLGFDAVAVRLALRQLDRLTLQADDAQTPRKVSYDARHLSAEDLAEIRATLGMAGQYTRLVYSAGLHLDVLPAAAGKGIAASFLVRGWGALPDQVMVFGDTGNDIDLFKQGFRGTVVANALPELTAGVGKATYRSPLPFAFGVLDGMRHWSVAGTSISGPSPAPPPSDPTPAARRRSTRRE